MKNHLRIALKHLLDSCDMNEAINGNYHVKKDIRQGEPVIAIYHIKFFGQDEFQSCLWNPDQKSLLIDNKKECPREEIIFVIRTIYKLKYYLKEILKIDTVTGEINDITNEFEPYFQ